MRKSSKNTLSLLLVLMPLMVHAINVVQLKDTPIILYEHPSTDKRLMEVAKDKITLPVEILKISPGYLMIQVEGKNVWIEDWVAVKSTSKLPTSQPSALIKVTPVAGVRGIGE